MKLELRDLTTSESIFVPEEGLTFGRAGGDAQVTIRDAGVSKRHARVWGEGGAWFLEDLGSSNGTHLADQRLSEPMEIMAGDVFALSKMKFEVVAVVDEEANQPTGIAAPKTGGKRAPAPEPQEQEMTPAPPVKAGKSGMNPTGGAKSQPPKKVAPPKAKPAAQAAEPEPEGGDDGEAEAKGVGYFFVAVPKAVAFYLAAIPLLLVNPIGSIKKGIANQKFPPMGRMELIAYAIPPLVFSAFLGSIATGIALAVRGLFSIMSFIPVVPAISALIGAVVAGFVWHPVLNWVVNKLQGQSTEKSRTNYFLMTMTGIAVLAIPSAVGTLLSLVPIPFIPLVGVLLMGVASLASMFIAYSWFNHFEVVKWFRTVILVLGGLGVLGTLGSGISTTLASLHSTPTIATGGSAGEISADAQAAIDEAKKATDEAMKNADPATREAMKKAQEAQAAGLKAAAEAQKAGDAAKAAGEKAAEKAAEKPAEKTAEKPAEKVPEKVAEKAEPKPVNVAVAEVPTAAPAVEAPAAANPAPAPIGAKGYPGWKAKRDHIEKRITDDPTLLNSVSGLLPLYRGYQGKVYEVESKFQKASSKKPAEAVVNAHLRDAELFDKTDKDVQQLFEKLGGR